MRTTTVSKFHIIQYSNSLKDTPTCSESDFNVDADQAKKTKTTANPKSRNQRPTR